jgi:D-tyrosyl-tRNA(Tyr) deacylase
MIAVLQRASQASVTVEGDIISKINSGLLVLLGIEEADHDEDVLWLSQKIVSLRIFDDAQGVMNKSIRDVQGELLVVSQFTLHASTKKGNRPSYMKAARPEQAKPLYDIFINTVSQTLGREVQSGRFGTNMQVHLINDGPVTIIIDTKNKQ